MVFSAAVSSMNLIGAQDEQARDLAIVRRVALRFIPFLMACYIISWLNRVNLSFAALQMNKDLGLTETAYGLGAGLFFVTYCLCEIPSNLLLHKFGASRWIARIMLTWGMLAVATAFIRGPLSFYVMRLLLGAAEAGFYPGVLYFFTLWFPAAYRGRIIGLFLASISITGIIGAPLSGWLLTLDGLNGLRGWQWLYIIEGLPAIMLAPLVVFLIQDTPAKAKWLPDADRARLESVLSRKNAASTASALIPCCRPWPIPGCCSWRSPTSAMCACSTGSPSSCRRSSRRSDSAMCRPVLWSRFPASWPFSC